MPGDFLRALAQLGDRRFLRVFGLSLLGAAALLAAFLYAWSFAVAAIPAEPTLLGFELGPLGAAAGLLAWAAGAAAAAFLMFPVAAVFIGLFLEEIADAVEARHYPHVPPAGRMGFWELLADGLVFAGALILLNLVALVAYLVSGPAAPAVFLALNGWLLGRQYFEIVAARRLGAAGARRLRRAEGGRVWLAGVFMALLLSVPILNLAVPVLGVAAFTHAYHRAVGTPPRPNANGRGPRPRP